jgi:hypothetical protein
LIILNRNYFVLSNTISGKLSNQSWYKSAILCLKSHCL